MTGYTPGPWRFVPEFGEIFSDAYGDSVNGIICTMKANNGDANARLIAAAPELLVAAKVAYETLAPQKDDDFVWAAMTQLFAAIAKSGGQA